MKNTILISFVFVLAIPLCTMGAGWTKPEHITFTAVELRAKEIQHAVFAVQIEGDQKNEDPNDDWQPLGTGFFVRRKDNVLLGVTCRHIILATVKMKKKPYIGFDDKKHGYIRLPCDVDYIDQKYDVAILRPLKAQYKDIDPASKTFPRDKIGDNTNLVAGRGVIIPGYPLGLGVTVNHNYPVFRLGIIAQYAGGDSFLIDGVASHGNSGSPIFCLKETKIVGMIGAHKVDRINLFDENGQIVAALPYNAGLAQGISAEVIGKILDELDKKAQSNNPPDKK